MRAARGLAAERTQLAWTRTLLAGTVVAVLVLRVALHTGLTVVAGIGTGAALLGWSLLVVLARRRIAALHGTPPAPARREPLVMTLLVVGYAGLAIAFAVLP